MDNNGNRIIIGGEYKGCLTMLKENKKLTPIFDLPADATLPLDLAFITNKEGETLKERFIQLIKDSSFFDCLVAYFYVSGFHLIYKALQNTEKIRILIGIATNKETYNLIRNAEDDSLYSSIFSHAETKQRIENILENEISDSEDGPEIEKGIQEFIKWIREKKLEIRVYPSQKIHAKLYIITFKKGDRDKGRVITGSSNFTQSGLIDNLEFNVELKNSSDYNFAKQKLGICFTVLFALISFSAEPLNTIQNSCWLEFTLFLTFGSLLILTGITTEKVLKPISTYRTINVKDITEKEYMKNETEYKLFLAWHYWKVYEENHKINEKKGWWLQKVYFGLLIPLFFILCTMYNLFYF